MTLKDDMAADVETVFLNTDDFAEAATFYPKGGATGFACTVLIQEPQQEYVEADTGVAQNRRVDALGLRSALRTGIQGVEGSARSPRRGDVISVATGAYAGAWQIVASEDDVGGGVNMRLALDSRWAAAGPEARRA